MGNNGLQVSEKEKYVGALANNRPSPKDHISETVGNVYSMSASMIVPFTNVSGEIVKTIILLLIKPMLEKAAVVCSPHLEKKTTY